MTEILELSKGSVFVRDSQSRPGCHALSGFGLFIGRKSVCRFTSIKMSVNNVSV